MKNTYVLLFAVLLITSCTRQSPVDQQGDKWNGYSKYLKMGEVHHTLFAGAGQSDTLKGTNVGSVTYGIDNDANFYVTYTCTGGWTMSETHMYAGDKAGMPVNKPGSPKIGLFPYSTCHSPRVSTYTIRIPLTSLPPAEEPGFVVATHSVVRSPSGRTETAWGYGQLPFNDKAWGWYDIYYFNQPEFPHTILYGTASSQDSLRVYHLNMTTGNWDEILKEYVGGVAGSYDATAFDLDSGLFFFVNYNTRTLYMNNLRNESSPSVPIGTLEGTAASATFYDDTYYYVNADFNTINKVTFNDNWSIMNEVVMDSIPHVITVNDIAMSPDGLNLYLIGVMDDSDSVKLFKYVILEDKYYDITDDDIILSPGVQIAYGADNLLYVISPIIVGGTTYIGYTADPNTGVMTEIQEGHVVTPPGDDIIDLSTGPIL
jgi:hypothetical protein